MSLGASFLGPRLPSVVKAIGRSWKSPCVAEVSLQEHRRLEANGSEHKKAQETDALMLVRCSLNEARRHMC